MSNDDTPTLGWRAIPAPPTDDAGPPRPSAVEERLAALLNDTQAHPEADQ